MMSRSILMLISWTLVATALMAQEKVDYARQIDPIFKRSCYSCHGNPETDIAGRSKKAKGGVRLDSKSLIMAPRRSGSPLVKPSDASNSLLFELISLPADDPDIMPPDDSPLKAEELALIKRWIDEGANFGSWQGSEVKETTPTVVKLKADLGESVLAKQEELLKELAEGLKPFDSQRLKNVGGGIAQLEAIAEDSPLYRLSFNSHQEEVNDTSLKALSEFSAQIVELRLGRTKISDKSLGLIAQMPRLLKLDLNRTEVGDAGLKKLEGLRHLQVLNLFGTKVSDAGLPYVVSMPKLEKLYLWNSAVTEQAVATLEKRLPKTEIFFKALLPTPDDDEPQPQRRRRMN